MISPKIGCEKLGCVKSPFRDFFSLKPFIGFLSQYPKYNTHFVSVINLIWAISLRTMTKYGIYRQDRFLKTFSLSSAININTKLSLSLAININTKLSLSSAININTKPSLSSAININTKLGSRWDFFQK